MFPVALWSKYPSSYVEGKIEPKLRNQGILVLRHLSTRSKAADLSDVEAILVMNEMASHTEIERLQILATSNKKKIFPLSRKESFWPRDLSKLEHIMSAPKAISDTKLESFCHKYIELRNKGMSHDQMVSPLASFWENGKLTNSHQLSQYVRNLVSKERAPKFFQEFIAQCLNEKREQAFAHEQVMEELKTSIPRHTNGKSHSVVSELPSPRERTDSEIYEELYREEMATLTAKSKELQAEIERQEAKIRELETRLEQMQPNDTPFIKMSLVVGNIIESVELGINTKEFGFDRIAEFYARLK